MKIFKYLIFLISAVLVSNFIGSLLVLVNLAFTNLNLDTTNISNVGFLMFIGIANVNFSWARSIEEDTLKTNKQIINLSAVIAIVTAMFFVSGSLFKYILLNYDNERNIFLVLHAAASDKYALNACYKIAFIAASLLTIVVTFLIVSSLYYYIINKPILKSSTALPPASHNDSPAH